MSLTDALQDKLDSASNKQSSGSSGGKNKYFRFESAEGKAMFFGLRDACMEEVGESGTTQAIIPVWFWNKLTAIKNGEADEDFEDFIEDIQAKMEEHAEDL